MSDRQVEKTEIGEDGNIVALCGKWGVTTKSTAIREIHQCIHRYYVVVKGGGRLSVQVVDGASGQFLTTSPEGQSPNGLAHLPKC